MNLTHDHYIYYCGQKSLRRNGVAIMVNERVQNAVLGCNLKNDRMISVRFQGKPFNITVIQVYPTTSNTEEADLSYHTPNVCVCVCTYLCKYKYIVPMLLFKIISAFQAHCMYLVFSCVRSFHIRKDKASSYVFIMAFIFR